jgi:hypothetical protein
VVIPVNEDDFQVKTKIEEPIDDDFWYDDEEEESDYEED